MICRMKKHQERRGQILIINAVNEVERKNAQSSLKEEHIEHIANAYENYKDEPEFAKVITIEDTVKNNYSLSIPLYVKAQTIKENVDDRSVQEKYGSWKEASAEMNKSFDLLNQMLERKE